MAFHVADHKFKWCYYSTRKKEQVVADDDDDDDDDDDLDHGDHEYDHAIAGSCASCSCHGFCGVCMLLRLFGEKISLIAE